MERPHLGRCGCPPWPLVWRLGGPGRRRRTSAWRSWLLPGHGSARPACVWIDRRGEEDQLIGTRGSGQRQDWSMASQAVRLRVAAELRLFLTGRHRRAEVDVDYDGVSSLGHLVESLGPPLTEVGALLVDSRAVPPAYRPRPAEKVDVVPVRRPQ